MVNRKRMLTIGAIPASLLLLGAASWGIGRVVPQPSLPAPQVVHARPEALNYACPAGIVDPFHLDGGVSAASVWNSAGERDISGEWTILRADASAHTLPTTLGVMGQGGGELRGLSMTSCQLPANDQWSVLGSSTSGEDLVVTFANPNSAPSVVTLEGYGANGPIDAKPHQMTIPARSTQSILAGGLFPEESALAVHIHADGQGVATWVQSSAMQGEVPKGVTSVSGTKPKEDQLFLGLSKQGTSSLRLLVPPSETADEADTHVALSYTSDAGTFNVPGGELDVSAGTVVDVPLNGITDERYALRVHADRPLVAQVVTNSEQEEYPGGQRWGMRVGMSSAQGVVHAQLPSASTVEALVRSRLSSTILRGTAQESGSGVGEISSHLLLTSVHPQSGIQLQLGNEQVTLEAGKMAMLDLPSQDRGLESPSDVAIAIEVEAKTPSGVLRAVWPLSADDVEQASTSITVH